MIAFVKGAVADVTLNSVVVEVGGVGLELNCTPNTLARLRLGSQATLPTTMIVREDSMTLFGFLDEDEKSVFEMLLTASGVGPKLAQAMLAVLTPDELRRAVGSEDFKTLTMVPGIGQKGAQRIVLELKDRIGPVTGGGPVSRTSASTGPVWRDQVHAGLVGLGWSTREAEKAVEAVAPQAAEAPGEPDVAALLRAALRSLSRA